MIVMIDTGVGNLKSVMQAFDRVSSVPIRVTTQASDVEKADAVILPGVGACRDGIHNLSQHRLIEPIQRHALEKKKPILGFCLGMQLMADESEEFGLYKGLGLIRGRVVKLNPTDKRTRVPNMGWNDITILKRGVLLKDIRDGESFYFAHSYHIECIDPHDVVATIEYGGQRLAAAIEHDNIFGVQFHPEKSQDVGLDILNTFLGYLGR